jgi:Tol biopolymer transport system component
VKLEDVARRAANDARGAVEHHASRSALDPLDRLEIASQLRLRNRRIAAGIVGVALAVAIVAAFGALRTRPTPVPASVPPPTGRLLLGEWHQRAELADWWTVDTDGAHRVDLNLTASCAIWFPHGDRILITDDASGFPLRPAVVSPTGELIARLDAIHDPKLSLGCGDVSPDGTRIALEGFDEAGNSRLDGIYTVRASDGGDLERLTSGGVDGVPSYSPDGSRIVFFRSRVGVHPDGAGALFVVGVDGSHLQRITPWGAAFLGQRWSPDGQWIVFQRPFGELYLVHPDGSDLHRVPVELPAGTGAAQPSWSPDGSWIVFSLTDGETATIAAVHPDGTALHELTAANGTDQTLPDWRPS